MSTILNFDQWLDVHGEELSIKAAESGADRELGFDPESYAEAAYRDYELKMQGS